MAVRLTAGTVTYNFSGAMVSPTSPTHGPIVSGAPVVGSFTLDLSAPGQPTADPNTTDYGQQIPPADFALTVAGLTIRARSAIDVLITRSNVDDLRLEVTPLSLSGPGWSYAPMVGGLGEIAINFNYPGNTLTDLANAPDLSQFPLPISGKSIFLSFPSGNYTYPGGSFTVGPSDETHFSITAISLVPEPSCVLLVVPALVGLVGYGWRRLSGRWWGCADCLADRTSRGAMEGPE
jgi:hypothetical protein